MKCKYYKKCRQYDNCENKGYCGLKEDFMTAIQARAYTKKHIGTVKKKYKKGGKKCPQTQVYYGRS